MTGPRQDDAAPLSFWASVSPTALLYGVDGIFGSERFRPDLDIDRVG